MLKAAGYCFLPTHPGSQSAPRRYPGSGPGGAANPRGVCPFAGVAVVALRAVGYAVAILEIYNHTIQPSDQADYDRSIDDTRALLEKDAFETAWAEGRAMTLEEAVENALEIGEAP